LKLATIPQKIGIKKTKTIGVLLGMLFFFLEFFKDELSPIQITISLIITIVMLLLLVFARVNQGRYYSSFWVEGIPIFWLLLILIF